MKKILVLVLVVISFVGCTKSDNGELVGVEMGRSWMAEQPYGTTLVPGGSFTMGAADYDIASTMVAPSKTVSVSPFYMDETEISNNEYKQFVFWVRDSLVRHKLAMRAYENENTTDDEGLGYYRFVDIDTAKSPYYQFVFDRNAENGVDELTGRMLNWKKKIIWNVNKYPSVEYSEVLDSMYLPEEERFYGQRIIDARKLVYSYNWFDLEGAVKAGGNRKDFLHKEELAIYPDTTVWIRDFSYSYNEPMQRDYFWHVAFSNYPVVGVNYKQAKAFCAWRTKYRNDHLRSKGRVTVPSFRLPTEAEWEYAARGGLEFSTYPWGGPYAEDDRGCFMANFKPMRGDYMADGSLYTVEVGAFYPNDYGLYNMAGNVSEWTNTAYDPSSYMFVSTMNPNYENTNNQRKVIRGGSWKDVAYFLQVSTRDYEYRDSARSYIGFRTVQSYQGTDY